MKFSQLFLHLGVDKCGQVWYNKGGVQRAADEGQGPNFRSDTPIWNFFATSSDFAYAPDFPEKWPRPAYADWFCIKPEKLDPIGPYGFYFYYIIFFY